MTICICLFPLQTALIDSANGRSGPRTPRSKTPEPRTSKPRNFQNRDHSVGNVRRVKAQTLTSSAAQAILQQQQQRQQQLQRLSPNHSYPFPSYLVDNRHSPRGGGVGEGSTNRINRAPDDAQLHQQQPQQRSSSRGGGGGVGGVSHCLNGNDPPASSPSPAFSNENDLTKVAFSSSSTSNAPLFTFGREGKGVGEFQFPRNILIDDEQKVGLVGSVHLTIWIVNRRNYFPEENTISNNIGA